MLMLQVKSRRYETWIILQPCISHLSLLVANKLIDRNVTLSSFSLCRRKIRTIIIILHYIWRLFDNSRALGKFGVSNQPFSQNEKGSVSRQPVKLGSEVSERSVWSLFVPRVKFPMNSSQDDSETRLSFIKDPPRFYVYCCQSQLLGC